MASVLLVDDERNILVTLARALKLAGHRTIEAESAEAAMPHLSQADLLLLDVRLPGVSGLDALTTVKQRHPDLPVVMMSGHGTIETAVQAVQRGAFDFIEKPLSSEKVLVTIDNALKMGALARENRELRLAREKRYRIVGKSQSLLRLLDQTAKVARSSAPALILGENGTGKELLARRIVKLSPRQDKAFIKVNCVAIPTELIESELFGHEKGAFTSAVKSRKGKFELADGGTLFLDEIGDMKPEMQAKLLRVLQEGEIERVGSSRVIQVDVRIIAATNKDLQQAVAKGAFRQDLYYRIAVLPLRVPPLRERKEDIPLLADHFISLASEENDKARKTLDEAALARFRDYPWPGNVRELGNIIERLMILCPEERITADDVDTVLSSPGETPAAPPPKAATKRAEGTLKEQVAASERAIILDALKANHWHITRTSQLLQIERSHLYRKMQRHGIRRES